MSTCSDTASHLIVADAAVDVALFRDRRRAAGACEMCKCDAYFELAAAATAAKGHAGLVSHHEAMLSTAEVSRWGCCQARGWRDRGWRLPDNCVLHHHAAEVGAVRVFPPDQRPIGRPCYVGGGYASSGSSAAAPPR